MIIMVNNRVVSDFVSSSFLINRSKVSINNFEGHILGPLLPKTEHFVLIVLKPRREEGQKVYLAEIEDFGQFCFSK